MKGMTAMFLCIMALFVLASCENTTRVISEDKDTAVTDIPMFDGDNVAQNDDVTNDDLLTDDPANDSILPDDVTNDDPQTDDPISDNTQNDNVQNDNAQPDNNPNDNVVTPDADIPTATCNGFTCDDVNSHCEVVGNEPTCVCDEGYHWNTGVCVEDTLTATGTFSFDFTGPVNAEGTSFQQLLGGEGTADFSHLGTDFQYGTVSIYGDLHFPLSTANGSNIVTMWIDSFSMGGAHFFMFSLPAAQNTAGAHSLSAAQAVVTYGDMTFSRSGMTIDCIRAMSNDGNFTIGTVADAQLDVTSASGNLYDPAVLGTSLPYPICAE